LWGPTTHCVKWWSLTPQKKGRFWGWTPAKTCNCKLRPPPGEYKRAILSFTKTFGLCYLFRYFSVYLIIYLASYLHRCKKLPKIFLKNVKNIKNVTKKRKNVFFTSMVIDAWRPSVPCGSVAHVCLRDIYCMQRRAPCRVQCLIFLLLLELNLEYCLYYKQSQI